MARRTLKKVMSFVLATGIALCGAGITASAENSYREVYIDYDFSTYNDQSTSAYIGGQTTGLSFAGSDVVVVRTNAQSAQGALGKEAQDISMLLGKPQGVSVNQMRITTNGKRLIHKMGEDGEPITNENGEPVVIGYGDKVVVSVLVAVGDTNDNTDIYFPYYNRRGDGTTGGGNRIMMPSAMLPFRIGSNGVFYSFGNSMSANVALNRWYNMTFVVTVGNNVDVQNKIETYLNGELLASKDFGVETNAGGFEAVTGVDNLWMMGTSNTAATSRAVYFDDVYETFYFDAGTENILLPEDINVTSNDLAVTISNPTGVQRYNEGTINIDKLPEGAVPTIAQVLDKLDITNSKAVRVYAASDTTLQTPLAETELIGSGMVIAIEASDGRMFKYYKIGALRDVGITDISLGSLDHENKMITGIEDGTVVEELIEAITTVHPTNKVTVVGTDGEPLNATAFVSAGNKVIVTGSGGGAAVEYTIAVNRLMVNPPVFYIDDEPVVGNTLSEGSVKAVLEVVTAEPDENKKDASLILAVYDDDKLVDISLKYVTVNTVGFLENSITVDDADGKKVKAFLWGADTLLPLAAQGELVAAQN